MPYDAKLAQKIRKIIQRRANVTEREQFGGVGFLYRGNMAVGVIGRDLLVRVGQDQDAAALKSPHTRPFALTGRPSKGWILVAPQGSKSAAGLRKWVELGLAFAKTLPAK
jgi:TfoX/Sxy family transcriptional regulator of competence genes